MYEEEREREGLTAAWDMLKDSVDVYALMMILMARFPIFTSDERELIECRLNLTCPGYYRK